MPLSLDQLRSAASRLQSMRKGTLEEARAAGVRTAFLCHSHADRLYVQGAIVLLREAGWDVYVDWADASMPATPNEETARKIKLRIAAARYFLFLATTDSMASRWCPWEIGYADGIKSNDDILVIPTSGGYTTHGSEYLGLYRRIDVAEGGGIATWRPRQTTSGTWVRNL